MKECSLPICTSKELIASWANASQSTGGIENSSSACYLVEHLYFVTHNTLDYLSDTKLKYDLFGKKIFSRACGGLRDIKNNNGN